VRPRELRQAKHKPLVRSREATGVNERRPLPSALRGCRLFLSCLHRTVVVDVVNSVGCGSLIELIRAVGQSFFSQLCPI